MQRASELGDVLVHRLVRGVWHPTTTNLLIEGQNGPNGMSTECFTVTSGNCDTVPEPVTLALLASGLSRLALPALRRRRKQL